MPETKTPVGRKTIAAAGRQLKGKSPARSLASPGAARAPTATEPGGKRRLLDAAAIEFCERGFDGASVLDIAKRAGVKQPLLNYHFGSKEQLWRAVIEEGYRETVALERATDPSASSAHPLDRLRRLLISFAQMNIRRPSVHAIMHKELSRASPRRDWLVDTYMRPFNKALNALIEECVANGLLRPIPTEQASVMMTGILIAYVLASELPPRMYGTDLKSDAAAHAYIDNALDVLFDGMLTQPQPAKARHRKVPRNAIF